MPNWCDTKLTLRGSEQDLIKFDEQFSGVYTQYSTGTSFVGKVGKTHEEIA